MTNERWRAEMPATDILADGTRMLYPYDVQELVTRANAELDAAEAREAALTKERDELKAQTASLVEVLIQAALDKVKDDERIAALEAKLAARRASDGDVRALISFAGVKVGTEDGTIEDAAVLRLLAAPWLKKEGG